VNDTVLLMIAMIQCKMMEYYHLWIIILVVFFNSQNVLGSSDDFTSANFPNWAEGEFLFSNISEETGKGFVNISYQDASYEGYWSNNTLNGMGRIILYLLEWLC